MGPPPVRVVLMVVLGVTAALPATVSSALAVGRSTPVGTITNMPRVDNQCSPLQRKQELLDARMNERDTRLINALDTRLSTQLDTHRNEVNTRFNRMDSRLDGIETAISDMKGFLQERMAAVDKKVELALTAVTKTQGELRTTLPNVTPLQGVGATPQPIQSLHRLYKGCEEALSSGVSTSGIYTINPECNDTFNVYCEQRLDGGGWTVFQSRSNGVVDFYNDWNTYKAGFGELMTEFWLGNDKIHTLTRHHNMQLKIELTSPTDEVAYAEYSRFWIEDEAHKYTLRVSGYTGGSVPGDSLSPHNGRKFSTKDQDNDIHDSISCARHYVGSWWYENCHNSNLNGLYGAAANKGMRWHKWKGAVSMKATRMMIRRRP